MAKSELTLVVGARANSLGAWIANAVALRGHDVQTAGLTEENVYLDLADNEEVLREFVFTLRPRNVIVTAGINYGPDDDRYLRNGARTRVDWYIEHLAVNAVAPMNLYAAWLATYEDGSPLGHFIVTSSNSAQIARTQSAAYCASKAALSMAVRCEARELARSPAGQAGAVLYGYEPGLLEGTPMTDEVRERIVGQAGGPAGRVFPQMHRMPGIDQDAGISPEYLGGLIAYNLHFGGRELNGCMFRIDAGEQ